MLNILDPLIYYNLFVLWELIKEVDPLIYYNLFVLWELIKEVDTLVYYDVIVLVDTLETSEFLLYYILMFIQFEDSSPFVFDNNTLHSYMIQFGVMVFALSIAALLCPNYFGLYGAFILTCVPLFWSWVFSLLTMNHIYQNTGFVFINGFKWFNLPGGYQVTFDLLIDKLSITYVCLILSIGLCVLIYAFSYFRYEPHVERLFLFINLFMISMCILVLGGNLFVLFFGWELIGLTSFFLINFWSTKMSSLKAAFKAFVFNKISDLNILLFIIFVLFIIGDGNIVVLNNTFVNFVNYNINLVGFNVSYLELLSFFIMTAAFVKSAQFGVHVWLPDSMEAPVPASALIHSATLVSAGVFLLLRFSCLFELTQITSYWIMIISSLTAAFGGVGACFQSDIKRILAYSTISHCGFLIFLTCINNLEITLLYLCVHGFFKALVFMCVGNIIRFARNYQDFRYMGGFYKYLPFESIMTLVGLINLGGLPFSFGFFIKHYTLVSLFEISNIFIKTNLLIGMCTGVIYCYRLYYYVFFDTKKAKKAIYFSASKKNLRSSYYSNTTLASNIAIILLFSVAVAVITYMYINFFILFGQNDNVPLWYTNNVNIINSSSRANTVVSYFVNFIIIIIGFGLIYTKYRYQFFFSQFLDKINYTIFFCFFLFFFLNIIVF